MEIAILHSACEAANGTPVPQKGQDQYFSQLIIGSHFHPIYPSFIMIILVNMRLT